MFRIGIIGTENSHALAFSKLINLPPPNSSKLRYPDARVVGVYGPDAVSAKQIVDEAGADFIADDPKDFFGKVDAMMFTNRKGSLHYKYALPFIEQGIPVFIDKPFTVDMQEAEALIGLAKEKNVNIFGGSGCKLCYDAVLMKNAFERSVAENIFLTASLNYPADTKSIHDGFFFYSSHLTEIILFIFGYDIKSVAAFEKNESVTAVFRYENFDITALFTNGSEDYTAVLYTTKGNFIRPMDSELVYGQEIELFINMLRKGEMPFSYEELIRPVAVINAIMKSVESGIEILV